MSRFSKAALGGCIVSALLVFLAGCSTHPNDDTIAKNVQSKVAVDPVTKDSAVIVTSKDGKVSLRGSVKDGATQQKLEQIAREEPGVTGVDDQVAVLQEPAAAPEQAANTPATASCSHGNTKTSAHRSACWHHAYRHCGSSFEFGQEPERADFSGYFGPARHGAWHHGNTQGIKRYGHSGYGEEERQDKGRGSIGPFAHKYYDSREELSHPDRHFG